MSSTASQPLPLDGIRILEFTHAIMGPACGLVLGDLGAEVIHVEPPQGDPTRDLKGFGTGFFPFFSRNKKSLALNIKSDEGREIIMKLAEPIEGESRTVADYVAEVTNMTAAWARVHRGDAPA